MDAGKYRHREESLMAVISRVELHLLSGPQKRQAGSAHSKPQTPGCLVYRRRKNQFFPIRFPSSGRRANLPPPAPGHRPFQFVATPRLLNALSQAEFFIKLRKNGSAAPLKGCLLPQNASIRERIIRSFAHHARWDPISDKEARLEGDENEQRKCEALPGSKTW